MAKKSYFKGFWERIKDLFSQPDQFFKNIKNEKGIGNSIVFLLTIALCFAGIITALGIVVALIMLIISIFIGDPLNVLILFGLGLSYVIISSLITIAYFIVGFFFGAFLLQIAARMLGGKGKYSQTYQISLYSLMPFFAYGWIPLIGMFAILHSLILRGVGIKELHKLSDGQAVGAMFIYVGFFVVLAIILGLIAFLA